LELFRGSRSRGCVDAEPSVKVSKKQRGSVPAAAKTASSPGGPGESFSAGRRGRTRPSDVTLFSFVLGRAGRRPAAPRAAEGPSLAKHMSPRLAYLLDGPPPAAEVQEKNAWNPDDR